MACADILVFGGTGFVGRSLVSRLAREGHHVTVVTRHYAHARHLLVLPQVDVIEVDVHCAEALSRLFQQSRFSAVINLAASLSTERAYPYGPFFEKVHVKLPKNLAAACTYYKIPRFIHMSALGAALTAPSSYLRSRFDGDQIVLGMSNRLAVTVFRPSVIFGEHDAFTQRFAGLLRHAPWGIFPSLKAEGRLQPVWVEDVVTVIVRSLDDPDTYGRIYPLGGPAVYSLPQIIELVGSVLSVKPKMVDLPYTLSYMLALFAECWPGPLVLSRDMLASLQVSSMTEALFPYGIQPREMEDVIACYLNNQGLMVPH